MWINISMKSNFASLTPKFSFRWYILSKLTNSRLNILRESMPILWNFSKHFFIYWFPNLDCYDIILKQVHFQSAQINLRYLNVLKTRTMNQTRLNIPIQQLKPVMMPNFRVRKVKLIDRLFGLLSIDLQAVFCNVLHDF